VKPWVEGAQQAVVYGVYVLAMHDLFALIRSRRGVSRGCFVTDRRVSALCLASGIH